MRIRGYDEETEQLSEDLVNITGDVIDLTKTASNPDGISLFTDETQEHYKDIGTYLHEISDIWSELDEKSQQTLLEKLFGKNRAKRNWRTEQKCAVKNRGVSVKPAYRAIPRAIISNIVCNA